MILFSHMLVGAAIGSAFRKKTFLSILLVIISAIASHYIFDAIPHYDYDISGFMSCFSANFWMSFLKASADFCFGLILIYILFKKRPNYRLLVGSLFAVLPDFFVFFGLQMKNVKIVNLLAGPNYFFHSPLSLPFYGIIFEILVAAGAFWLVNKKKKHN